MFTVVGVMCMAANDCACALKLSFSPCVPRTADIGMLTTFGSRSAGTFEEYSMGTVMKGEVESSIVTKNDTDSATEMAKKMTRPNIRCENQLAFV